MSVADTPRVAGPFATNGATTVFPFEFKVLSEADIAVEIDGAVTGVGYVVTLNPSQDTDPGGSVTITPALASGSTVVITSATSLSQPTVFANNGGFYPRVLNDSLDRLTIIAQEQKRDVDRAIKMPLGEEGSVLPSSEGFLYRQAGGSYVSSPGTSNSDAAAAAAAASAVEAQGYADAAAVANAEAAVLAAASITEAQFYANEAAASAATISAGQAVRAETVDGFDITYLVRPSSGSSHASTGALGWAKAFDAHATTDGDSNVRIGREISAVTSYCKIPATATAFRARVFSRANTENGLPEGGYDTLMADTGAVALADALMSYDADFTGYAAYALPLPTPFVVAAGLSYLFVFEFQDASGARVAASVPYKTATVAQRNAGYLDTGAGWTNYTTSRVICAGFGEGSTISLTDALAVAMAAYDPLAAARAPSLVRPVESLFLRPDPFAYWQYPGVTTAASGGAQGLSRVLGKAAWSPGFMMGQEGVTFGCRIARAALINLTADAEYSAGPPKRILLTSGDTGNNARRTGEPYEFVYRAGLLEGAYFDIQLNAADVLLEDCIIDATPETTALIGKGVDQASALTDPGVVHLRNVTVRGFYNVNASVKNAHLENCYFDFSVADTLSAGGGGTDTKVWIDGCLMRRPGAASHPHTAAGIHSDVIAVGANINNLRVVGSVLYYTASSSPYSEGVVGDTSGFAAGSLTGASSSLWFLGNIIGGASYNVYLGLSNAAARVNNVFYINNVFLTQNYATYYAFYLYTYVAGAQLKNMFLWDNRGTDGGPVRLRGSRLPLAANVPAIAAGAQITITTHAEGGGVTAYMWTPGAGTMLRGMFNFDAAALGDAEVEALVELGRNYGVTIIDPLTRALNPLYNLGNWVNS